MQGQQEQEEVWISPDKWRGVRAVGLISNTKTGPALVDARPRPVFDRGKSALLQSSCHQYSHSSPKSSADRERNRQARDRAPIDALPLLIGIVVISEP